MTFPLTPNDVDIEIYYDAGWQNINQYVYHRDMSPITITRGRSAEGKNCDPGTLTLTLNNRDGRFAPRNPNSTLFGKIGRNTPIRVSVTYGATTYVRFVGEITSWPSRWDVSQTDVWVPVQASGILRRLGQGSKPLALPMDRAVLADNPTHYWRLDDPAESIEAKSSLVNGGSALAVSNTVGFAEIAAPPGGDNLVPRLNDGSLFNTALNLEPPWSFEFSVQRPSDGTLDSTGFISFNFLVNGAITPVQFVMDNDVDVSSRDWYHYLMEGTQNGANYEINYWRNGLAKGVGLSGAGTLGILKTVVAGDGAGAASDYGMAFLAGYTGVGVVDAEQHSEALQAYAGVQAHERFEQLCTTMSVPFETVGDSSQEMTAQRPVTFLQSLRDAEATDQGLLHETRDSLGLRFRTNASRYTQVPIALDYDVGHISAPFDPEPDDKNIANDREVKSRQGGVARRELTSGPLSVQDPPSGIGRYDDTITVDVFLDAQLVHIANWRLHVGTWDAERYPRVTVDLAVPGNASIIPAIAGADSGDLITIDNLPAWLPPERAELLIEGYREQIGFFTWDFVFACSPAGPYSVVGRWPLISKELHTAMNTSVTSADIANTSTTQPMLETSAALIGSGYPITIGGEQLQLTAVAASTVTFGSAGTASTGSSGSRTPGLPGSAASGDLILIFASTRNSGTGSVDTPSNWTRLPIFPTASNCAVFGRIYDGVWSMPTVTFTAGSANEDTIAQSLRLGGKWHSVANVCIAAAPKLNTSAPNITCPTMPKPSADDCIVLYFAWKQDDFTSTTSPGTEIQEASSTAGNDASQCWSYTIQTTATAITTQAFNTTGGASAISRGAVAFLRCDYQTATVTRSTNGVTASHSAADAVTATNPLRWGLL